MTETSYTAKDITVLEGLEPVRLRPGMYIGSTGQRGLHHLVYEVVDNSVDEALAGHNDRIEVTLHPDHSVTVRDWGRGMPVDRMEDQGESALTVILTKDTEATAHLAMREDASRAAADLLLVSASLASLAGVAFGLLKAAQQSGAEEASITGLAVLSVVLSCLLVQVVFTLRYARLWYTARGGVEFNEDEDPDYRDFAYLAFTIGMTYQVSDTNLTTKAVRRAATRHALLSYVFGTAVIAVMINVVAGLLNR